MKSTTDSMRPPRLLFSLLMFASVLTLLGAPIATSQNQTTVTSNITMTSQESSTAISTGTSIATVTRTNATRTIFPVKLTATLPARNCFVQTWLTAYNGTAGAVFFGSFSSSHPVDLYLVGPLQNLTSERRWLSTDPCDPARFLPVMVSARNVSSYTFNIPIEESGMYDFLAINRSHKETTAVLTLAAATKVVEVVTSTIYSTSYPLFVTTATLQTMAIIETPQTIEQNLVIGALVGLVALGAVAAFFRLRRRKR